MLVQRLRRWPNIDPAMGERLMCDGLPPTALSMTKTKQAVPLENGRKGGGERERRVANHVH